MGQLLSLNFAIGTLIPFQVLLHLMKARSLLQDKPLQG
jgi:hypothetical protein